MLLENSFWVQCTKKRACVYDAPRTTKKLVNLVNDAVNLVNFVNDDSVVSDVTQQEVTILQVVDGF